MSVADFRTTIQEIKPMSEEVCLHILGEPLLHPDFASLVDVVSKAGLKIRLVTNGMKTQKHLETLSRPKVFREIAFSVQSFMANRPQEELAGYLKSLVAATRTIHSTSPDTYINFRFWNLKGESRLNEENRTALEILSQEFGFDLKPLEAPFDPRMKRSYVAKKVSLHFDSQFEWPNLDRPSSKREGLFSRGTCLALKSHFGILSDRTVVPCCLDAKGGIPLGKADGKGGVATALMSERAQSMMEGFRQQQLREPLCQSCGFAKRFLETQAVPS